MTVVQWLCMVYLSDPDRDKVPVHGRGRAALAQMELARRRLEEAGSREGELARARELYSRHFPSAAEA